MSISSLDTDLDLCDLGVASVMSSPDIQRTQLPLIEDQEFHPVIIDQLDPQGAEEGLDEPLLAIDSLLPMLRLVPGLLVLDDSVYRIRGSINETTRHTICSYAERVGEFTLTDDVHDNSAKLSPSIFLCLAQLQGPLAPLFPNLRHLRIVNADYSLDYLRLFLSPSLKTLEIVGLGEACGATLLSFLSAAVVEVPNLTTLILGPGRFSREVVDACLGFGCLRYLELVDVVSEADFRLLNDIGRLEYLEMFVIDAQGVGYAPSKALIQAEEEERARAIAEEEFRRLQCEAEEQEQQRRFEEEVEERQRKAMLPRTLGVCWMCERRFKKAVRKTQCSPCTLKLENDEDRRREAEEQKRCKEEAKEEQKRYEEEVMAEHERNQEEERLQKIHGDSSYQETAEEEDRTEDLEVGAEMGHSVIDESLSQRDNTNGLNTSADANESVSIDLLPKFPKLSKLTVRGSPEMMQDLVELITSASVVLLCLDMVPVHLPNIATPPSRRFVDTVDSALRRWAGTMAHVTLSDLPSVSSKLSDETVRALVRLPHLEHLEVNGWDIASNIADYFCCLEDTNAPKLKVLHLPHDNNAISIPLLKLRTIAEACPNLRSLRCRFDNLLDIPSDSVPVRIPFPHPLETLTVGDTQPRLDSEAVLEVARYVDNLFPKIKAIKPLEDVAQNADQWKFIDRLVKFRQSGWLDRIRS